MLKSPSTQPTAAQLLAGLIASIRLLLVALALIVVIVALFTKSLLSFAVVVLTAANLLATWIITLVGNFEDVSEFAAHLGRG